MLEVEAKFRVGPAFDLRRRLPRVHRRRARRGALEPVRLDHEFLRREVARHGNAL